MKKITTMRIASILLIAVLMTTCAISGTFAKYVTSADATDTARVAKWGVTVTASSGTSFANTYTNANNGITVKATDKVVAPGTSSEEVDGDVKFTITGTPEVATKVTIKFAATSEIKLAAGDYLDYTTGNDTQDTFTLDKEYYPVKFTLTKTDGDDTTTVVDAGTLKDVETKLNADTKTNAPNVELDVTYTLTWAWAFDADPSTIDANDKADTYLGQENRAQTFGYTLNITVEQVD